MAYDNDDFWDDLEEENFHEEISRLKICLEEKNMIIDTLTYQLAEKEKHNEKLECEIVGLRKDLEKTKSLNLRFAKGSETLNEIIEVQCSPLIKTGLGYTEEASQSQKLSTSTKSYLDAAKTSKQYDNRQQRHKADHQVNHTQFSPRMNINRSLNQPYANHTQFSPKMNINRNYNQQVNRFNSRKTYFMGNVFHVIILGTNMLNVLLTKRS